MTQQFHLSSESPTFPRGSGHSSVESSVWGATGTLGSVDEWTTHAGKNLFVVQRSAARRLRREESDYRGTAREQYRRLPATAYRPSAKTLKCKSGEMGARHILKKGARCRSRRMRSTLRFVAPSRVTETNSLNAVTPRRQDRREAAWISQALH